MKQILSKVDYLSDIVGEQDDMSNTEIRKSSFYYEILLPEGKLVYNSLTKELILIKPDDDVTMIDKYLIKNYFYVPCDFDEVAFVNQCRWMYNVTKKKTGICNYTILTTTDCNARCYYCYQLKNVKKAMSLDTAHKLVAYIKKTYCQGSKIRLSWFGGEPLYNASVIDVITEGLKSSNIDYESTMISNGYLFDDTLVKKSIREWKLVEIQITLDGTEKKYNKIKSYIYNDLNPYKRVLKNIELLLDNGVDVKIRLNLSHVNIEDICLLVDELGRAFEGRKNLWIYSRTLFQEFSKYDSDKVKSLISAEEKILQMVTSFNIGNDAPKRIIRRFHAQHCMVDSEECVVIFPDGKIGKCLNWLDDYFIGHIDKDEIDYDVLSKLREYENKESCAKCVLYPECINLKVCKEGNFCYKEHQERKIANLHSVILNEYDAFLEREKNGESEKCEAEKTKKYDNC